MELKDIISAAQYQISGGSEYLWSCYGSNARFLDFTNDKLEVEAQCVFDSKTQEVFEASLYLNGKAYKFFNPRVKEAYYQESFDRNIDPRVYIDDHLFIECELLEDFLDKLNSAFSTGHCDNNVLVNINIDKTLESAILDLAQEANMSLQEFIQEATNKALKLVIQQNSEMWEKLIEEVKDTVTVRVDLHAPLSFNTYNMMRDKILNSNKKSLNLQYKNKLVSAGLKHMLRDGDFLLEYF